MENTAKKLTAIRGRQDALEAKISTEPSSAERVKLLKRLLVAVTRENTLLKSWHSTLISN